VSSAFALTSAALFAFNALCVRWALRGASALTITLASVVTNFSVLWLVAILSGPLPRGLQAPAAIFLLAGALSPALARLTLYKSIELIGVSRASTISNTAPLYSAILAVPLLGEHLSWRIGVGTVLVVMGLALTLRPEAWGAVRRPWAAGALLALNTAVMASVSFILRKLGMRLLPLPALASALTMTGALLALLPYVLIRARADVLRTDQGSLKYLLAAGLLSSGGFLLYFFALDLGTIVTVTPLANTTPLFAIAFLRLFRQGEPVALTTLVGAVLAVAGILFVVGG